MDEPTSVFSIILQSRQADNEKLGKNAALSLFIGRGAICPAALKKRQADKRHQQRLHPIDPKTKANIRVSQQPPHSGKDERAQKSTKQSAGLDNPHILS